MPLFTEGRLQAYERMMQDTGRNHRREKPDTSSGRKYSADKKPDKKPEKKAIVKNGVRHGSISG